MPGQKGLFKRHLYRLKQAAEPQAGLALNTFLNAVVDNNLDIIRTMIQAGILNDRGRENGMIALTLAAQFQQYDVINYLLHNGAKQCDLTINDLGDGKARIYLNYKDANLAEHTVSRPNNAILLDGLDSRICDFASTWNSRVSSGLKLCSALACAITNDDDKLIATLTSHFAAQRKATSFGTRSPSVHILLTALDMDLKKPLFAKLVNVFKRKKLNQALLDAMRKKKYDMAQTLAENGAQNNEAFLKAVKIGNETLVRFFHKKGMSHDNALHTAIQKNNVVITDILLQLKYKTSDALVLAVANGHISIARKMLSQYAKNFDVDGRSESLFPGMTPLMCAASAGDQQMVGLLLEYGADRTLLDLSRGKSALALAEEHGHSSIADLLDDQRQQQHGAGVALLH